MTTIVNDILNAARDIKAKRSLERQVKAVSDNIATIKRRAGKLYELPPINIIQMIPYFTLAVLKQPEYIGVIFRDNESIADFLEKQGAVHLGHTARVISSLLSRNRQTYTYRLVEDPTSPFGVTVNEFYSYVDTDLIELPPTMDREAFFKTRGSQEGRWLTLKFSDKLDFEGVDESVKEQVITSNALITMFILMLAEGKKLEVELTHEANTVRRQIMKLETPKVEENMFIVQSTFQVPAGWEKVFTGDLNLDKVYARAKEYLTSEGKLV